VLKSPPGPETNPQSPFARIAHYLWKRKRIGPYEDAVVTERTLARARAGYEAAFLLLIDPWEELQLHWQRIQLGEPTSQVSFVCVSRRGRIPGLRCLLPNLLPRMIRSLAS
jgi:hypothetical protein